MSYESLFHDMIVESQGTAYAERNPDTPSFQRYLYIGERQGMLNGITLCMRTLSEAGHLDEAIYKQWHDFRYSREMDDPEMFREVIMQKRSEE